MCLILILANTNTNLNLGKQPRNTRLVYCIPSTKLLHLLISYFQIIIVDTNFFVSVFFFFWIKSNHIFKVLLFLILLFFFSLSLSLWHLNRSCWYHSILFRLSIFLSVHTCIMLVICKPPPPSIMWSSYFDKRINF